MNPDPVPPVRPLLTHVIPGELVRREAGVREGGVGVVGVETRRIGGSIVCAVWGWGCPWRVCGISGRSIG